VTSAIDIQCVPFTPEAKRTAYSHPELKASYLRHGMWDKEFTAEDLVRRMDSAGIDKALVPAPAGCAWEVPYALVAEMTSRCPGRLFGLAGIDPRNVMSGVVKLERAVTKDGFVGAHIYPHWFGLAPDHRAFYPFYSKCVELDVPVQIQVGLSHQASMPSLGRPDAVDRVAVDFPELAIIGIHVGYPWEREMITVAWKHPGVYIGVDGPMHPRDWPRDLVQFIASRDGRTKVLFGTNYPALDFTDALDTINGLGFDDETRACLFRENAKRLYDLA
jgi:predicted TIM-barrel fold metal-dependent hydrolase